MKASADIKNLWTCPKCKRQFERQGQSHSCKPYPLEKHFENKPAGKILYEKFRGAVKREVGSFKIESLECCIHFVSTSTFVAVKILRDKIRVDFSLSRKIINKRIAQNMQLSANRYLYYVDISSKDEIDKELIGWIWEAHEIKNVKTEDIEKIFKQLKYKLWKTNNFARVAVCRSTNPK
jgi:hypothetical protein